MTGVLAELVPGAADAWLRAVGWMILHSLWQGVVVAAAVALVLRLLRGASPSARYAIAAGGLALMVAAPLATGLLARDTGAAASIPPLPRAGADGAAPGTTLATWMSDRGGVLALAWLGGVLLLQLRLLLRWHAAQRLRRTGTRPAPSPWPARFEALRSALGIDRTVQLRGSARARVPMQIGWWRPIVLVPVSAWTGLTETELRAILAHELAHVRRHDYLVNLLQAVAETALFHHPAAWWLSRRVREEREYCCDDLAVAACGNGAGLARGLARLALRDAAPGAALASTGGPLVKRIERLLGTRPVPARRGLVSPGAWLAPALLGAAVLLALPAAEDAVACPPEARAPVRGRGQRDVALEPVREPANDQRLADELLVIEERSARSPDTRFRRGAELRAAYTRLAADLARIRAELDRMRAGAAADAVEHETAPAPAPARTSYERALAEMHVARQRAADAIDPTDATDVVAPAPSVEIDFTEQRARASERLRAVEREAARRRGDLDAARRDRYRFEADRADHARELEHARRLESLRLLELNARRAAEDAETRVLPEAVRRAERAARLERTRELESVRAAELDRAAAARDRIERDRAAEGEARSRAARRTDSRPRRDAAPRRSAERTRARRSPDVEAIRRQIAELQALLERLEAAEAVETFEPTGVELEPAREPAPHRAPRSESSGRGR